MESSDNLYQELGRKLGLDQPLVADGRSTLVFDGSVGISFLEDPEGRLNAVLLVSRLRQGGENERALRLLMESNFLPSAHGGARFVLDAGSNKVALVKRWESTQTDPDQVLSDLGEMISSVETVRKNLASLSPSASTPDEDQDLADELSLGRNLPFA